MRRLPKPTDAYAPVMRASGTSLTLQTNRPCGWRRLVATGLLALVDAQGPLGSGSSASSGLIGHAHRVGCDWVESHPALLFHITLYRRAIEIEEIAPV